MRQFRIIGFLLSILIISQMPASADGMRRIRIAGRKEVMLTTPQIQLGDIAEVSSSEVRDDEAVIGLKKIWIGTGPEPTQELTLSASQVIERVQEQGVNINEVGYTFPRIMTVKRAGRFISADELQGTITQYLKDQGKDTAIKQLQYNETQAVVPGLMKLIVESDVPVDVTRRSFQLLARVDGAQDVRFSVPVVMDEFREIPIARRTISKGAVVTEADVTRARMNSSQLPKDATDGSQTIVGLEATHDIIAGEVFRNTKLALPLAVTPGSKVVMQFKTDFFEATATGVALEGGAMGQTIRIRNDDSKKVVAGNVIEAGMVRVK